MAMKLRRLVEDDNEEEGIHPLCPKQPFRMLVIGPSNSGKTTTILPLILDYLIHDYIFVYSKYTDNDLYKSFFEELDKLKEEEKLIDYDVKNDLEDLNIESLKGMNPNKIYHIIHLFDDMINEKGKDKNELSKFYTAGRHVNVSVISIFQGFKNSSQKTSRSSASNLLLFPGISEDDLKEIFKTYGLSDLGGLKEFINLYSKIRNKGDFLYIDLESKNPPFTKYRLGFNRFYNPKTKDFEREPEDVEDIMKILDNLKLQNKSGGIVNMNKFGVNKNLVDRLDIVIGEIESGNNNPILIEDLKKILRERHANGKISQEKAEKIYDQVIKKFKSLRK